MGDAIDDYKRILVIDDNLSIHDDFRKILQLSAARRASDQLAAAIFGIPPRATAPEFEVISTNQGQHGLELVHESVSNGRPFGAAFVDMRMPGGWDGLQTIEALRAADTQLPCVICTAFSDYSLAELNERLDSHFLILKKPFDAQEVQQLALTLSEKRRAGEQVECRANKLEQLVGQRTAELQFLTETDPLTSLPNRQLFLQSLERCVERTRWSFQPAAVLIVDLDNFRLINDTLGHRAGDELLVKVAERFRQHIRASDGLIFVKGAVSARLGGDEFAILAENLTSPQQAHDIARRLQKALRNPIEINNQPLNVTASIGVAFIDRRSKDAADVMRMADTAVYEAKAQGKNCIREFQNYMFESAARQLALESDLRTALANKNFELFLQPIFRLSDLAPHAYEALLRWRGPEGQIYGPGEFIAAAEQSGAIIELGRWILADACRIVQEYQEQNSIHINVNISRRQLVEPGFVQSVVDTLNDFQIDGSQLNFEITESAIIDDREMIGVLNSLRSLGIQIQLDDFGTGMSSLGCLQQFPIDVLKIDQSFVSPGPTKCRNALVESIIQMARALEMEVIAEGIETSEQFEFLRSAGCLYGQGYLLGKPAPVDTVLGASRPLAERC